MDAGGYTGYFSAFIAFPNVGKEEMCREEVNRAGMEGSVVVEDSTQRAGMALQSLIRCSD